MNTFFVFYQIIKRDFQVGLLRPAVLLHPLFFFALVVMVFVLAMDPSSAPPVSILLGIFWSALLLSALLAGETLFKADAQSGTLLILQMSLVPLWALSIAKMLAHWCLSGLPLVLISPFFALWLGLPETLIGVLLISTFLGSLCLSAVGALGQALTVGLGSNGLLISLMVLPLYLPVLIFGTGAVHMAMMGVTARGPLFILGGISCLAWGLVPFCVAGALRLAGEA